MSYDTKYKIIYEVVEGTFPELWITFFFTFNPVPQNKGWSKTPNHSLDLMHI